MSAELGLMQWKLDGLTTLKDIWFQTPRSFVRTYSVVVINTKLFHFSCKLAGPANPLHLPGDAEGHHDGKHGGH